MLFKKSVIALSVLLFILFATLSVVAATPSLEFKLADHATLQHGRCGEDSQTSGGLDQCNSATLNGMGSGTCFASYDNYASGCGLRESQGVRARIDTSIVLPTDFTGELHIFTANYGHSDTKKAEEVYVLVNGQKIGKTSDNWCNKGDKNCHAKGPFEKVFSNIPFDQGQNIISFQSVEHGGSVTVHKYVITGENAPLQPQCMLTFEPSSINQGDSTTFKITTANARSLTHDCSQDLGKGIQKDISLGGSLTILVTPQQTQSCIITVYSETNFQGEHAFCQATINVKDLQRHLTFDIPSQVTFPENSGFHDNVLDVWDYTESSTPLSKLTYTIQQNHPEIVSCGIQGKHNLDCNVKPGMSGVNMVTITVTDGVKAVQDTIAVHVLKKGETHFISLSIPDQEVSLGVHNNLVDLHAHTASDLPSSTWDYTIVEQDDGIVSCAVDGERYLDCIAHEEGESDVTIRVSNGFVAIQNKFIIDVIDEGQDTLDLRIDDITLEQDSGLHNNLVNLLEQTTTTLPLNQLDYEILSQSRKDIVDCVIDHHNNLDCEVQEEMTGVSTLSILVDGGLLEDVETFTITVIPKDEDQLTLNVPDQEVQEGSGVHNNFINLWTHTDTTLLLEDLTYTIISQSNEDLVACSVDRNFIDCTVHDGQGISELRLRVSNGALTTEDRFKITVVGNDDHELRLKIQDQHVNENSGFHNNFVDLWDFTTSSEPLQDISYTVVSQTRPDIIHCFLDHERYLDCNVKDNMIGSSTFTIRATDGTHTVEDSFDIIVQEINDLPNVFLSVGNACQGHATTFGITARDPERDSLTITWDFGDGSEEVLGREVRHTYQSVGTFTVTATVDDGHGSVMKSSSVNVNRCVSHDLSISTAFVEQEDVRPGDRIDLYFKVENRGTGIETVSTMARFMSSGEEEHLESFRLQPHQGKWRMISMHVPYNLKKGVYVVNIHAESSHADDSHYVTFNIE